MFNVTIELRSCTRGRQLTSAACSGAVWITDANREREKVMKLVLTGEGPGGRSRVEKITDVGEIHEPKGRASVEIWDAPSFPPILSFERKQSVDVPEFDLGAPPGAAKAQYAQMGPDYKSPMHRTHTLDVAVITAGSAELALEDGGVELFPGDTIVMPGVVHAWKAGPNGCVMVGTAYGIAAP